MCIRDRCRKPRTFTRADKQNHPVTHLQTESTGPLNNVSLTEPFSIKQHRPIRGLQLNPRCHALKSDVQFAEMSLMGLQCSQGVGIQAWKLIQLVAQGSLLLFNLGALFLSTSDFQDSLL